MEPLIEAIESNGLYKAREFLLTNPQVVQSMDLRKVVGLVDDPPMLHTIFNMAGKEINSYFKKHQKYIFNKANEAGKGFMIIELILNLDKDFINRCDKLGMTPLMKAVIGNREVSFIDFLLKMNADVNVCDSSGKTPLHFTENSEVIKCLIENGAMVNITDSNGNTPLMHAIGLQRNREVIVKFIENGADLEVRNRKGKTCLHLALELRCDVDIINLICSKTRTYNVEDKQGLTPLCYALTSEHYNEYSIKSYKMDFILELINKGFVLNVNDFMCVLRHCDNVNFITSISKYIDIKCVDKDGNCVLHHARDVRLITKFVRSGVPINHKNNKGITPLMNAIIRHRSVEVVESLLFWGSDIRKLDIFFNPIKHNDLCTRSSVYDLLVLYGMSVSLKNNFIKGLLSPLWISIAQVGTLYYTVTRNLVGHIFVSNENVTIPKDILLKFKVRNLIKTFNTELNKMKHEIFTGKISYYNFCMKEYRSIRSPFLTKEFTKADCENIAKLFPTFSNEVIVKIKINIRINKRKVSLRKLMDVCLSKRSEKENILDPSSEYVTFDNDAMDIVASYLTDREINCLLAAAIID